MYKSPRNLDTLIQGTFQPLSSYPTMTWKIKVPRKFFIFFKPSLDSLVTESSYQSHQSLQCAAEDQSRLTVIEWMHLMLKSTKVPCVFHLLLSSIWAITFQHYLFLLWSFQALFMLPQILPRILIAPQTVMFKPHFACHAFGYSVA